MKLGKLAPLNKKSLSFGTYLKKLPDFPIVDLAPTYDYPMDLNDQYGICVVAGWDHSRQVITGLLCGEQKNFSNQELINFYKTQNPHFPHDDNGMVIQTFLEYLTNNGYIKGFARIDFTNPDELRAATYLGLSIITGAVLTAAQEQEQYIAGQWKYVPGLPIIGGHCINGVGYDDDTSLTVVTWGKLVDCTQDFVKNQMDEAWFILMQEHIDHPSFRNHFDIQGFSEAVSQITDGKIIILKPRLLYLTHPMMHGDDVTDVQTLLIAKGALILCDGWFGQHTKDAVITFQKENSLVPDGILGPLTLAALKKKL